jgi:UDP:flavonoid glycosyltransferase YjiC (YdhE family)
MHAILVSMGSDGDVFPFIGLGIRLRARGHRVTLVANEHFHAFALRHGFDFRALVSTGETDELLGNPDVWHPVRSALVGARWGRRALGRQFALLSEVAREEDSVLVAYPPVFTARLVQEKFSRPLASLVVMPWMILSEFAPPTMAGAFNLPGWAPRPAVRLYWRLLETAADLLIGRHVNRLGHSLGLKRIGSIYRWSMSPQTVIGLFPDWYAPPQPDWPPQIRLAGFGLFDGGMEDNLPGDLDEFCRAGPPPVAFTYGSEMRHAARFFRAAVQACKILGARGVLLTKRLEQLPDPLPPLVRACRYAPFRVLFPRCAAVVHHGGMGTTAQALAAGLPQLILPMAWDQPDNAARVKRLGTGDWLPADSSGDRIAKALARLMTPETRAQCRVVAAKFGAADALETAADYLEEFLRRESGQSSPG